MIVQLLNQWARGLLRDPSPLARVAILLLALIAYGSSGYLYYERGEHPELTWGTAIWYSLVTITTVGYGDFYPTSTGGRFVIALPLMFLGIGLLGYVLSLSASALVEAKAKALHGMNQVKLKKHLVMVNYPGLGKVLRILDELNADRSYRASSQGVVLVDEELDELPPELAERGVLYVRGNPTRDATLSRAAVDSASHAIVLSKRPGETHSDDLCVAVTLAIEARNPDVTTVVECVDDSTEELLRKAGSDRIVCTSKFDSHFLSQEVLNPGVQDVIAQVTSSRRGQQIYLTRYVGTDAFYREVAERCSANGHILLGLREAQNAKLNLDPETRVETGVQLITIGPERLREGF